MISITSAQLDAWLALFIFPLSRILGLLATAPVFNNAALPVRMRLIAGLAITLALAPALPPLPALPASSWLGLIVLGQQILIGVLLGFALRITFAAVDVAGELIGLQMGLSFATFFDPTSGGQTPVVAEFLGLLTALVFLAMNGHLLALSVLAESFTLLPVSGAYETVLTQSLEVQPNPFTNVTSVRFGVARDQAVQLSITDLQGREIQHFRLDARQGLNTWTWQPEVGAGVYFIRLQTAEGTAVRKVVKS